MLCRRAQARQIKGVSLFMEAAAKQLTEMQAQLQIEAHAVETSISAQPVMAVLAPPPVADVIGVEHAPGDVDAPVSAVSHACTPSMWATHFANI